MNSLYSLDSQVRHQLKRWPQQPPGLDVTDGDKWLRACPDEGIGGTCLLKLPGSKRLRTWCDGLWINFGGTPNEPFADIFAIEACSTLANLADKRSRFAPSTQSLMVACPIAWLMAPVTATDSTPRWRATGVLLDAPTIALVLPIRDIRVMYGLQKRHYQGFIQNQVPHPHEYYVPMDALTAVDGDQDPAMRALVARASVRANFLGSKLA